MIKYIVTTYNASMNDTLINIYLNDVLILENVRIICISLFDLEAQVKNMVNTYIDNQNTSNEINNIVNTERIIEL